MFINEGREAFFVSESDCFIHELSVFENEESRDAHNAVTLSDISRSIDIELCDICFSFIFLRVLGMVHTIQRTYQRE